MKDAKEKERLARLRRAGIIRRTPRRRLEEILRVPPIIPEPSADPVSLLLAERRRGR